MAEELKKSNGESTNEESQEEKPFRITVLKHESFQDIVRAKYLSTTEFCKLVSAMFRPAYADYDGSIFEISQQGYGYVSLFFNHAEKSDGVRKQAISRNITDDTSVGNDIVRKIRLNDSRNKNGDKFFLTQDGKDGVGPFFDFRYTPNRNGIIDWGRITAEVAEQAAQYGQRPVKYTKVSLLDPTKLATEIFGEYDEAGDKWEYGVRILKSIPQLVHGPSFQGGYMLAIEAVRTSEVQRLADMMGINGSVGLNIIR